MYPADCVCVSVRGRLQLAGDADSGTSLPVTVYADGVLLGPDTGAEGAGGGAEGEGEGGLGFHAFAGAAGRAFVADVLDGYCPALLRASHPDAARRLCRKMSPPNTTPQNIHWIPPLHVTHSYSRMARGSHCRAV